MNESDDPEIERWARYAEDREVKQRQRLWLLEQRLEIFERVVDPHLNQDDTHSRIWRSR